MAQTDPIDRLLKGPVRVVNVGLKGFADELRAREVSAVHLEWSPPAGGDSDLLDLLEKLGR